MDSNEITWVVLFNSNNCRIFAYSKKPTQLNLIKEINHPENRLHDIDLTSDKPGRYKSSNSAHGTYSQPSDPKEIKIEDFAREIANELEHNRNLHSYRKLIIIAGPRMNGLLHKHINQHIKKLIVKIIEKDLVYQTDQEILGILSSI